VAHQKRTIVAAVGVFTAVLALSACGSVDYGDASADISEPAAASNDLNAANDPAAVDVAAKPKVKPAGKVTAELVSKTVPRMGNVVTDAKGWVLYRFDEDAANPSKSKCVGGCEKIWPAVLAGEELTLSGISASEVDTVKRKDGGRQVTIGGMPLYRYIGDKKPGTWKGQNVNGAWFVVSKTGKRNLTCLPEISKPVKPRAAQVSTDTSTADEPATSDATDSYASGY
jgi:predicted lipoprotein with Yx(FWY)xxD motif